MYPHHVFDLEPAGTFRMYPICYRWVSGRYFQPEPAMYSRCFHWFPGPLAPSVKECGSVSAAKLLLRSENNLVRATSYYPCTIGHLFIPLVRGFAPGSTTRVVRAPKLLNPICTSTKTTNENWPPLKLIVLTPGIPVSGRLLSPVGRRKNSLVCPMMGSQLPSPS